MFKGHAVQFGLHSCVCQSLSHRAIYSHFLPFGGALWIDKALRWCIMDRMLADIIRAKPQIRGRMSMTIIEGKSIPGFCGICGSTIGPVHYDGTAISPVYREMCASVSCDLIRENRAHIQAWDALYGGQQMTEILIDPDAVAASRVDLVAALEDDGASE